MHAKSFLLSLDKVRAFELGFENALGDRLRRIKFVEQLLVCLRGGSDYKAISIFACELGRLWSELSHWPIILLTEGRSFISHYCIILYRLITPISNFAIRTIKFKGALNFKPIMSNRQEFDLQFGTKAKIDIQVCFYHQFQPLARNLSSRMLV